MGEGDASNTAVITVSLGRALISGESVVAPIALASDNGARLPGHATPDFAVAAMGTGVALSNATSATPPTDVHRLRLKHRAGSDGDADSSGEPGRR